MPQRADAPTGPNVQIDDERKYIVELLDLEETPSKFRDTRKDAMSIIWKFRVFDQETGASVIDDNTNLSWEFWQFTPDTTYANLKTGKKAKAREWTEAMLGRDLDDEQMNSIIDGGFKEALIGKRGIADLEWYTTEQGVERLRIIKLRPYRAKGERDLVGAAAGRPDVPESKSERSARLRRELEEAEKE